MWLTTVIIVCLIKTGSAEETVEVSTPSGRLLGTTLRTRLGKTIYTFRGIRYAQPPINELRFKPPVPIDPWSGIFNATADGMMCPQPTRTLPVSEDCLFLNVYTTKLPGNGEKIKRPAIIHFHFGGYYSGTGRSDVFGPQYLLDQDVVLVNFNHRLGTLGFLSVGKESPGNNGLKDQVLVIKWVKKNIAAFGGDPDNIVLFGYSAGARSVELHMVSPMSRGLFHKAIVSSGSPFTLFSLPRNQLEIAQKQARFMNCSDGNPEEIIQCLKGKSAVEMANTFVKFQEFGYDPILIWLPVVEEDYGQERFLTEDPVKLYSEGHFDQIPVLTGITHDELSIRAFPLVNNASLLEALSDNFEKYAPICFMYERDTKKSKAVSEALRKFYLGDGPLTNASLSDLGKIYADAIEGFPVNRAVHFISDKNSKPVYYYQFTYQGRYSYFYIPETKTPYGVVHHDDLIYSFYISTRFPFFNQSYPEAEMVEKLTTMWANFAKTGNPIPVQTAKLDNVKWESFNNSTQKYLEIGKKLVLKENMFNERYDFWRRFY